MDFRDEHVPGPRFAPGLVRDYPYLGWAEAHFYGEPFPTEAAVTSLPLSWEANASEVDYAAQAHLLPDLAARRWAAPHTWHAAEMFLALVEERLPGNA